jgi:hypothetical protein
VSLGTAPALVGFQKALDSGFRVQADDFDPVDVTLVQVTVSDRRPTWETFSLLFAGGEGALPQAMYRVDHADLGSFPLFLVPVLTDRDGLHYEAVFNRPRP